MSPAPKDSDLINPSLSPKDKVKVDEKEPKLAPPLENHVREHSGMKRAREGSLEPTPNPVSTPLATKKNRLGATPEHTHTEREEDDVVNSSSSGSGSGSGKKEKETNNVGEVRRKVQEMTWKEGQGPPPPSTSAEQEDGKDLKRKTLERNESSTLEPNTSPKKAKETPSPPPETELTKSEEKTEVSAPPAAAPAKKPQSTFGAFSSKSSPFSTSASGSTSTSSPFASGSGSGSGSGPGSGSKPLSTGSAFGSYSSTSSPFARKSAFGAPATVDREKEKEKSGDGAKEDETKKEGVNGATTTGSSFGDILKESKGDEEDQGDKVQMTEQDVHTGEEGEETVYQCRAKLYVMQSDGGWKERGVGALKLNVRESDGKSPRLVMRAEGVLRLMLNVSLYAGMSVLEDGKHVRTTVFEEKERRLVTFRLGSQKAASELCETIQNHIPLESDSKSPAPAPAPGSASASASAV